MKNDLQEVYAFAKTGSKGAEKFKDEDSLWDYMTKNKGNHVHHFQDQRIYVKAGQENDAAKEKAVRKVVSS